MLDRGGAFRRWGKSRNPAPYNSWGNGSAMRVSPVGFAFDTIDDVMSQAKRSTEVTHNHPKGIAGAQATAAAVFLARSGKSKDDIAAFVEDSFGYDLSPTLDSIRPWYRFDVSCQGTVPPALRAFLESESYEDAVRKAVSLGGDSDTLACIVGGVAQAFYGGVPAMIEQRARKVLDERLRSVVDRFAEKFGW